MTPRTLHLTLRAQLPKLSNPLVRKAILGLLDVDLLASVAAGSDKQVTLDQSLARSPSDPGYVPTAPPRPSREQALGFFGQAGYEVERAGDAPVTPPDRGSPTPAPATGETTRGRVSRDGQTLALVIGAAANDPISVAVANTAADQLRGAGVAATVLALDPPVLYGSALATNRVDAVVGWHAAGGDLATALASRFGCPALEATPIATAPVPPPAGSGSPAPSASSAAPAPPATTPPPEPPLVRAPSNLTGICDRGVQAEIDGALDGSLKIDDVIPTVEPRLWAMATVLPIMQDSTIVAAGPSVAGVSLTGAVPVGIVGGAGKWVKKVP